MYLISIIIPIYKAEKYLRNCLYSIIAQTYTYWEAILIDDGSPDNSGKICEKYAAEDSRFKVIHQKNGGVSVARQTGLDAISGKYVIHCDPDDWIEPDMLEKLISIAIKEESDMVICDYFEETADGCTYIAQDLPTNTTSHEVLGMIVNRKLHGSCCNKLIRSDKCKNIQFYPKEMTCYEDELFLIRLLTQKIKITYLPKAFYHYRTDNVCSITHSSEKKNNSRILEIEEIERIIDVNIYDNLFETKEELLKNLFISKRLKEVTTLYKDVHRRIIDKHIKYRFFTPLGYFFTLAIKGKPYIAYNLYKTNIIAIKLIQTIRGNSKHD